MATTAAASWTEQAKSLYVHASHKSGMDDLQTEKIAQITIETAANSSYTAKQVKLDQKVDMRVRRLKAAQSRLDAAQRQAARARKMPWAD